MADLQKLGDPNSAGGTITSGVSSVIVDGQPAAVIGLPVSPHPPFPPLPPNPPHQTAITAGGSRTVIIGGIPASKQGDADSCGHPRVGTSTVKIS